MEDKLKNSDIAKPQLIDDKNKDDYNKKVKNINISKQEELEIKSTQNLNNINNSIILNSLFKAVQENNINEIESNLSKDNSCINTLNNNGLSLLHLSVMKGNVQIVNELLKYGANPNVLSIPNKQTPLHLAYLSQESTKDNIINTLLSYNANENIIDLYNNKPSDYKNKNENKDLNTPDKKNKTKKEDLYYEVNDININFFSTSDIKKKSNNKKDQKISDIKCNCIFTPKKFNNNNIDSARSDSNYNFSDLKNFNFNFDSNNINENKTNKKNEIQNSNNNIFNNNNESIKDINIYENFNKNNENITKEDNNINRNQNTESINKPINENDFFGNNNLNDSLENSKENKKFDEIYENLGNKNIDELLKTIITNKRKSIADRSSSKKRNKYSLNENTNNFLKNNIFININNSNNTCTYISTQNQTSQKKFPNSNGENGPNEKNKNISEFKCTSVIKSNTINKNKNVHENNINNSNSNDNIIQKINKKRTIFKKWLSSINLAEYYENFIDNEIFDINQLKNIVKSIEVNDLFNYINSIIKTKKYGYIYRIICKLEIDSNLINSKIVNFMITDFKLRNSDESKLSISGGKRVLCGRNVKDKDEKNILKIFLNKNGLSKLYQNFCHNGFDIFEFVILQMYSSIPINDFILENHFHIYDIEDRKNILNSLIKEVDKINKFINSEEYLFNKINKGYNYEKYILENKNDIQIIIKDNDKRCNLCLIY